MQTELLSLNQWVNSQLNENLVLEPLAGDASFRSYYRVQSSKGPLVVMLAPPGKEKAEEFVSIARAWGAHGIQVPQVYAFDPARGYAVLSDFGNCLLYSKLKLDTVNDFYTSALAALLPIHRTTYSLPNFDETHTLMELNYFQEWFLQKLLGMQLTSERKAILDDLNHMLIQQIVNQPQVPVHRDYHCRNLMILENNQLGIIDFQDAMYGPITYDAVSLLKDCYIRWPKEQINHWAKMYWEMIAEENPAHAPKDFQLFLRWFDWTGLQRHIKVLGIFSRLKIRDKKESYLQDMPRIMAYVLEVTSAYPELAFFHEFLTQEVLQPLESFWQEQNIEQVA